MRGVYIFREVLDIFLGFGERNEIVLCGFLVYREEIWGGFI